MIFWFDTEFIEDIDTLDLISIGIVSQDGREYYAVNSDFDEEKADIWVKDNVIKYIPKDEPRKSNIIIKEEIIDFIGKKKPEFWVYNGAYDFVLFCKLFGGMRGLPFNYPWFANDIKQLWHFLGKPKLPIQNTLKHNALNDALWNKEAWYFLQESSKK